MRVNAELGVRNTEYVEWMPSVLQVRAVFGIHSSLAVGHWSLPAAFEVGRSMLNVECLGVPEVGIFGVRHSAFGIHSSLAIGHWSLPARLFA